MVKLHKLFGGNNGVMVTDLFIVHKAGVGTNRLIQQYTCQFPVRSHCTGLQAFFNSRYNILANVSGICSRISKDFMVLIESLHDVQSLLRGIPIFLVGFPLQRSQII